MRTLLRSAFVPLMLMNAVGLLAQRVTNVTAEQQGQELVISYALEADGPVNIDLFVSTDQGKNWQGPLSNCSGDVGKNVLADASKRIRWAVLEERELAGDGIRFKVVAKGAMVKAWLNPKLSYGSVTDIDGNTYATIQIGKQVWMAENLRTTRFRDGTLIPYVKDTEEWSNLSTGAWCNYNNDPSHDAIYGKLYNCYAVDDPRNICLAGWHVPSDSDWETVKVQLGVHAGGKMKAPSLSDVPNTVAANESGFSGLPGGGRNGFDGNFADLGNGGYWWSALESGAEKAWGRGLGNGAGIARYSDVKRSGFYVRCVRD